MPLFPSVAGGSQLHVNVIIAIVIPVILLISTKRKLSSASLYVVVLIFSTSQMLILISSLFGKEQVSVLDIQSILRPTFMMALVISFLSVLYEDACRDIDSLYASISKGVCFIAIVCSMVAILEVFWHSEIFYAVIYNLFKREYKEAIRGASTTFFGTTYYSGYIGLICLLFVTAKFSSEKSLLSIFLIIMCSLWVILSQSKVILFSFFASILLYNIIYKVKTAIYSLALFVIIAIFIILYWDMIISIVDSIDNRFFNSLLKLLTNPDTSGTLQIRLAQISDAFEAVVKNWGIGVGPGRSMPMESWLATVLYRYGILGIPWFLALAFIAFFMNYLAMRRFDYYRKEARHYARALAVWAALLPVTQLSSMMIETSKMMIFSMFAISLSLINYSVSSKLKYGNKAEKIQ